MAAPALCQSQRLPTALYSVCVCRGTAAEAYFNFPLPYQNFV